MLIDRQNLPKHYRWITFCTAIFIALTVWYVASAIAMGMLPTGGTAPGFTCGAIGGIICVFEFLLWPRKIWRRCRFGRTQIWMRAHIWLGLLSLPLVIYHTGGHLGGAVSTITLTLFLVVIASGIFGLWVQTVVPRRMLEDVPAETIHSQIDNVAEQFAREARRLVNATCGVADESPDGVTSDYGTSEEEVEAEVVTAGVTIGAVRSAGRVHGKVLQSMRLPQGPIEGSEMLRDFYAEHIDPFLKSGSDSGSPLAFRDRSTVMFQDLKTVVDPEGRGIIDALESLCEQRRQFSHQSRLHRRLHSWLWIHLPLSMALMVFLFIHAYVAWKYM